MPTPADTGPLRVVTPLVAHADELARACRRSRSLHASWVTPPVTAAGWRTALAAGTQRTARFLGRLRDDDEPTGLATLSEITRGPLQGAYLGFYALAPHHGRGLTSALVATAVRRGLHDLGLHRIEANVQPGNTASAALVRRLGFRLEGHSPRYLHIDGAWRDHDRWAITAEDLADEGPAGQNSRSSSDSSPRSAS